MILNRFVKIIALLFCKLFFLIQGVNRGNIPKMGGVIIASNHVSFLDPIVLTTVIPPVVNFMAKKELFSFNRFFGGFISSVGAFPVNRGKVSKDTIKKAIAVLNSGRALIMFPEGGRSKDGSIQEGEPGCVWLARLTGVLIVPAKIYGSDKAFPVNKSIFHPYPVKVVFGKTFDVRDYSDLSMQELTCILMDRIRKL
ncbi:MAG: lysophospholipid acyltransferase family protein [Candidatus Saelkia tenebricola]|nr:lysophospholipid acyltransferase family protein [Candidatus Saelkia tenebricola]